MRLLRTYVLKEHLQPFLVALGGLTIVLLAGNFFKFAELVIAKGVSLWDILRLLIYLIPYLSGFTIPMACLIAMVLAFGRLSTDYEFIAMRSSGVNPARLVAPGVIVGLLISVGLLGLHDAVVPKSHLAFRRQLKVIGIKQPTAYIEAGTFIKEFEPYVLFVYHVEGQKLSNIRLYEPQAEGPTRTTVASWGEFSRLPNERGVQLTLYDGTADEWDPLRPGSFYKVSFNRYRMTLLSDREDPKRLGKKLKEMTFEELLDHREALAAQGVDPMPVSLELHRKIASSFSAFVFVILGLAMGLRLHHHERLVGFIWILGIFVSYYLGTVGMNAVALKGWLPVWLATWAPNLVAGVIGTIALIRTTRQ